MHKYFPFQLFSLERVQYKLKGNWMMIMSQVGASIGAICRNHQFIGGICNPLQKLNYMQLCYSSHNGIKLALIGSSANDELPELVELVSAPAECMNANIMCIKHSFGRVSCRTQR